MDDINAVATIEIIIAKAAVDRVVTRRPVDVVVQRPANDMVVAGAAQEIEPLQIDESCPVDVLQDARIGDAEIDGFSAPFIELKRVDTVAAIEDGPGDWEIIYPKLIVARTALLK